MKSDLSILYRKHRTIFIIIQIEQLIKTPGRNTGKPDFLPTSSLYTCRFPASIVKIKQFIPVSPTHLIAVTWKLVPDLCDFDPFAEIYPDPAFIRFVSIRIIIRYNLDLLNVGTKKSTSLQSNNKIKSHFY